ncbi:MAG TPA: hypothetical protein VFQ25_07475 [Ktedonobacterales bacterium]|nr:hypothetical protein [Ktedonobacterales bacterium]
MKLAPRLPGKQDYLSRFWLVSLSALLALLLGACGVSPSQAGGSTSSAGPGGSGMAIRPCLGDYTGGLNAALTLSNSASVSGSAHVGDIIEIRLDGHHKWMLGAVKPSAALVAKEEQGVLDRADGTCVWDFQASEPGDVIITYSGLALCDPTQACPDYAIAQHFSLRIS